MFRLNDERKRAKTKFEAARLEFENARAALNTKKYLIMDIFKEIDSDDVSQRSSNWNKATTEYNKEQVSCLKKSESD